MGVAPPLVGVAVKVTLVPEQIVFPGFAVTTTLAETEELTVIVITFDVAGLPDKQFAFDVIIQEIRFPFVKPVVV